MIVADLAPHELARALASPGLRLRTGRIVTAIRSPIPAVAEGIGIHYAEHPLEPAEGFADFHVHVRPPNGARRFFRRQVLFHFEGAAPFRPLPFEQSFPMLEWGLNWCISANCHQYLILHAAVLERGGRALVMPAPPGSGKSTLCAALALSGWRLLSDELALIDPVSLEVHAVPRPVSLKNASIDVIRSFSNDARLGPLVHNTNKGTVAHMKPPTRSVREAHLPATPAWVVFPRYDAGSAARLAPVPKAQAFMQLVDNAFNYDVHGRRAFDTLVRVVDGGACFEFSYSRLEEALPVFAGLADGA
jgi:HprK-related kinase A